MVYPQFASVSQGDVWQLLTSMFTHVAIWHIGFNMLALWTLGPQLELAIGRTRFLAVYFISGLAGSATVLWFSTPYGQTLGASGAIFGLMGALLVVAIKVHGDVRGMLVWIGVNFVITFLFVRLISWQGHLGGFIGGAAARHRDRLRAPDAPHAVADRRHRRGRGPGAGHRRHPRRRARLTPRAAASAAVPTLIPTSGGCQ